MFIDKRKRNANIYLISNFDSLETAPSNLPPSAAAYLPRPKFAPGPNTSKPLYRAYISICLNFPSLHDIVCKAETLPLFGKQRTAWRGLPLHRKGVVSLCLVYCQM
jgi:hypothetical protein